MIETFILLLWRAKTEDNSYISKATSGDGDYRGKVRLARSGTTWGNGKRCDLDGGKELTGT